MKLKFGTCGPIAGDARYRPQTYLDSQPGRDLVYRLCQGPVAVNSVDPALLEGLELVRAVRVRDGQCFLNFTCFLRDDILRLNEHGAEFGASLADAVRAAIPPSPLRGVRFATRQEDVGMYRCLCPGTWGGAGRGTTTTRPAGAPGYALPRLQRGVANGIGQ